jgi:hypothetical protein
VASAGGVPAGKGHDDVGLPRVYDSSDSEWDDVEVVADVVE